MVITFLGNFLQINNFQKLFLQLMTPGPWGRGPEKFLIHSVCFPIIEGPELKFQHDWTIHFELSAVFYITIVPHPWTWGANMKWLFLTNIIKAPIFHKTMYIF